MTTQTQALSTDDFLHKVVGDLGALGTGALVAIGDRLDLYRAMRGAGPITSQQLADKTRTAERYVREWLGGQLAAGYVLYDPDAGTYELPDAYAAVLADDTSPACLLGGFISFTSVMSDIPKVIEAFRTGNGIGWHEHHEGLFEGTERLFRPGYEANLIGAWIPALDGVAAKLERGGRVADVGCGHGASTIIMARAYPKSTFVGFDYHAKSIERARALAKEAGVADRVSFEVAPSQGYPGSGYDLVAFFDCLHDMGDPVGAARHVRKSLADDGTWLLVEPFAGDDLESNATPVGRIFYAASTMICTPASLSQEVGLGLGAQAGESRLRQVVEKGGFTRFRRATETPFNLVLEARP